MRSGDPVTFTLDPFDAAAMVAVVRARRDDAQKTMIRRSNLQTDEIRASTERYIRQLDRCLLAIERAAPQVGGQG